MAPLCLRKAGERTSQPAALRFYNAVMRLPLLLALCLCSLALGQAHAQTSPAPAQAAVEPRIERIRVEDNSVRIEEVRVGGQTQAITVQPKNMPSYELGTHSSNRNPATDNSDSGQTSSRGWKVLGF